MFSTLLSFLFAKELHKIQSVEYESPALSINLTKYLLINSPQMHFILNYMSLLLTLNIFKHVYWLFLFLQF